LTQNCKYTSSFIEVLEILAELWQVRYNSPNRGYLMHIGRSLIRGPSTFNVVLVLELAKLNSLYVAQKDLTPFPPFPLYKFWLGHTLPLDDQYKRNHNDTISQLLILEILLMPAITIKNIPDDLYKELKHVAEQHHRSINSEIIVCLKRTLLPQKIPPKDRLNDIRALRSQVLPNDITPEMITRAINEGRT